MRRKKIPRELRMKTLLVAIKDTLLLTKGCFKLLGTLVVILGFIIVLILPFAYWTDRTLDFWVSLIMGSHIDIPLFISFVITLFFNVATFIVNILSELFRLFM